MCTGRDFASWVGGLRAGRSRLGVPSLPCRSFGVGEGGAVAAAYLEVFGSRPLPEVLFHYGSSTYLYTDFHCFPICALHTFLPL